MTGDYKPRRAKPDTNHQQLLCALDALAERWAARADDYGPSLIGQVHRDHAQDVQRLARRHT
jgi:hypothetical protein